MGFLRELIAADGRIDEREELALEAIERVLEEQNRLTLAKAGETVAETAKAAGVVAGEAASRIGSTARSLGSKLSRMFEEAAAPGKAKP